MSCGIISQMLGIGWKIMMANKVAALVWTRGAALVASLVVIVAAAGEALRVAMGAAKTMRLAQTIVNTIGHIRVMIATLGKIGRAVCDRSICIKFGGLAAWHIVPKSLAV